MQTSRWLDAGKPSKIQYVSLVQGHDTPYRKQTGIVMVQELQLARV